MTTTSGDDEGAGGLRRHTLIALLTAGAVLVITFVGVSRSRLLTVERRASADVRVLATVAAGSAVDLQRGLDLVGRAASELPSVGLAAVLTPGSEAVPGSNGMGFVPVSGSPTTVRDEPVLSDADRAAPPVAAVLDRAVDTGAPQISAAVDLDSGPSVLLVAATYATDDEPGPPRSSVDRRRRLTGWVVAPVDPAQVALGHLPPGMAVTVASGPVTFAPGNPVDLPDRLPSQVVEIQGQPLVMRAGDLDAIALIAPTIGLALGGTGLAVALAVGLMAGFARLRHQRAETSRRADQVNLIGDVAPLVQQSLELADVLPAVAVQLTDQFGLAGVSVSTGTRRAAQTEVFSMGVAPDPGSAARLRPPELLRAGETLTLALQRASRSVALLQLVAGRDLDESELQSLRAITELITAAVVNAALYTSQQEALQRLRDLDALKTVFLGTASHELRTPVTAIAGFASLLTTSWDRFDDEQRHGFAARIAANARSLSAVVQDLLDFSLLDRGQLALALTPVDLGDLVGSVVDRLGASFDHHAVTFDATPAPLVDGDVNGLERIVTNLLANAVKFSPAGSTISVSVRPDVGGSAIVVSDQGPGIPEEERERVFARFYRGGGDVVLATRGVGIGLSVVAEFVERMHGDVQIDDAPGGGARFTVRLPAAAAPLEARESEDATTA